MLETADDLTPAQQNALNIWLTSFYFAGIRVGDVLKLKCTDFKDDRLYYRWRLGKYVANYRLRGDVRGRGS